MQKNAPKNLIVLMSALWQKYAFSCNKFHHCARVFKYSDSLNHNTNFVDEIYLKFITHNPNKKIGRQKSVMSQNHTHSKF